MSGIGIGVNAYLHGGFDGNAASVTQGGNIAIQENFTKIVNAGRYVIRSTTPVRLPDVPASRIIVFNKEGNSNIWWAGYGDDVPAVGVGIPLLEGAELNQPCTNANQFSFIAENDGDEIYVNIFGSGSDVPLTPSDPVALDKIGPTITTSSPVNGATLVEWNAAINVTADKILATNSITTDNITSSPTISDLAVSLDSLNAAKINLTHVTNLAASTTYTITITTGVTNYYGYALTAPYSFSFTTKAVPPPPDTTPPTVVSSTPTDGAADLSPSTALTFTFSEAMLLSSFTTSTVMMYKTANNELVTGTISTLSSDKKTMTITGFAMAIQTGYRIDIIGGTGAAVTDLAGNKLAATYSISFTTGGFPTTTIMSVAGNYSFNLYNGTYQEWAEKVVNASSLLYNRQPARYTFTLLKTGTPPGNVSVIWRNGTTIKKTVATIAASSLTTSFADYTFSDSTNTTALAVGDSIGIRYMEPTSDAFNCVTVKISVSNVFDGTNSISTFVTGSSPSYSYNDTSAYDMAMQLDVNV